jgi:predicted Fe-Mo cluster-binding NifX family protein
MKVVVTSQGTDPASEVDPRFGRARYFILFDTDTGDFTSHDNTQNLNALQGAGIQAARTIADLRVEAVVTGNVGPKAFSVLQQANVKVHLGATGSVKDAFERFQRGELASASEPNVEGHWT